MSVYHGAAPESAFAPRTEKGDVTDERVCGCQGTGERRTLERVPFTYRPETAGVSTLCRKIFFQFGNRQVQGLGNSLMACPFHPTDLPGRESLKNNEA